MLHDNVQSLLTALASLAPAGASLQEDHRLLNAGDVFIAVKGLRFNGANVAMEAAAKGAVAIVHDVNNPILAKVTIPCLAIAELDSQLATLADGFYSTPSKALNLTAITGTNGKTSVSQFVAQFHEALGQACGVMGTLGNGRFGQLAPSANTTPSAVKLQTELKQWCEQGIAHGALEVSSHGLALNRVSHTQFNVAIFTNLTRDHLDFHGDMAHYAAAKKSLFTDFAIPSCIVNQDDEYAKQWLCEPAFAQAWVYGQMPLNGKQGGQISQLTLLPSGVRFYLTTHAGEGWLEAPLYGSFNAYNLTAAFLAMMAQGVAFNTLQRLCATISTVPGRMEQFSRPGKAKVIVDYAHTPDALALALKSLREHQPRQLWCIFGCGGDRDKGKRPEMGAIASKFADKITVTNDNPRTELPDAIMADICAGISQTNYLTEPDRIKAIRMAIAQSTPEDIILCAGKGHETYQIIGTEVRDYDERAWVQTLLGEA